MAKYAYKFRRFVNNHASTECFKAKTERVDKKEADAIGQEIFEGERKFNYSLD